MNEWLVAGAAVVGLCLGSFANVLIHRLPRNEQVVRGRSACPQCGQCIRWFDNVPVLSWLWLRGRCRRCRASISVRYPLVELSAGLLAVGCLFWYGGRPAAFAAFLFIYLLGVIAVIDWRHMIIPHTLTVAGMVSGVALADAAGPGLAAALAGLATGAGVVLLLSWGYRRFRGEAGMGGGDVMLMGMIGAFLGPAPTVGVLAGGALLGTLYVLASTAGRLDARARLPFGTFLAAAAVIALVAGPRLWDWYLQRWI